MPLILADEFASRSYELPTDLVRGELQVWSPSGMLKGLICTNVGCSVLQFVEDHNLGTAASNHTYILTGTDPDTVRGADLLYISYQKLPRDQITDDILRVAPEVVIEVENPPDRWLDFFEKIVDFFCDSVFRS